MYPLDRGLSGPTVRITHMRDELRRMVDLDVVSGLRRHRAAGESRYVATGRLRGLGGIYVESSTTLPGPADLAFLALARARHIPILTYIRDAYQLFPEYYHDRSLKKRLSRRLFRPVFGQLIRASDRVAFPSRGLADAFSIGPEALLLPPGCPPPVSVLRRAGANRFLYVGPARREVHGVDILIEAVSIARDSGHDLRLLVVARPGEEPLGVRPAWLDVRQASGAGIHELLPDVKASVIPRPRGPYNDLAIPIKLMEYLSYGRPLLVTDCTEQAAVVQGARAGLVVSASVQALADGVVQLAAASDDILDAYAAAGHRAALANSWSARASQVLSTLAMLGR